jgi:hypothetical protein
VKTDAASFWWVRKLQRRPKRDVDLRDKAETQMSFCDKLLYDVAPPQKKIATASIINQSGPVVQWIERLFPKRKVEGSVPSWRRFPL